MHLRDNTKVFSIRCANRMDRTEACLAAFVVSVQRNHFCTMGAFSRQNSPVKILFARKVQNVGSKTSAFRHLAAGAKFSEFGHPFVCFADISPNRGITPPYPAKCISCVGNGLGRSANLPTCWGGGTRKARDGGANYIKIYGQAWKPALTTGCRVVAPYVRIIFCA